MTGFLLDNHLELEKIPLDITVTVKTEEEDEVFVTFEIFRLISPEYNHLWTSNLTRFFI